MLLHDKEIRRRCTLDPPLISPFSEGVQEGVVSYGLTHAGYDLRLDSRILAFRNTRCLTVDPKLFSDQDYVCEVFDEYSVPLGASVLVPPGGYILGQSFEEIVVPRDLKGRCVGKSTYARCGVIVSTTPLEPGWRGRLTLEISNANPCPVRLWTGEGVCQLEFEQLLGLPEQDYAGKSGKYQDQVRPTPARVV